MSLVVVDTDVASTLLRRRTSAALARQLADHTIAITFVTYGELTKWTLVRHWGPRSLETMRTFLAELVVLPYDQQVATSPSTKASNSSTEDTPRGMPRGMNKRPEKVTGDTEREQEAQVEPWKASAITASTGLRRRERRFESCRGHHPLTSGYHFQLLIECPVWWPRGMKYGMNSVHETFHVDLASSLLTPVLRHVPAYLQLMALFGQVADPEFEG